MGMSLSGALGFLMAGVVWFFKGRNTPKKLFYGKVKGNCGGFERPGHDK
jgi:hypothetical protein